MSGLMLRWGGVGCEAVLEVIADIGGRDWCQRWSDVGFVD